MGKLEDVLVLNGEKVQKGDLVEIVGKDKVDRGYFLGVRADGLVYIAYKKDSDEYDSAYNINFYKVRKLH